MAEDDKKYAFPETFLVRRDASGIKQLVGIRYRWNTGETQIAWCQDKQPDPKDFEEEPIRPPLQRQCATGERNRQQFRTIDLQCRNAE